MNENKSPTRTTETYKDFSSLPDTHKKINSNNMPDLNPNYKQSSHDKDNQNKSKPKIDYSHYFNTGKYEEIKKNDFIMTHYHKTRPYFKKRISPVKDYSINLNSKMNFKYNKINQVANFDAVYPKLSNNLNSPKINDSLHSNLKEISQVIKNIKTDNNINKTDSFKNKSKINQSYDNVMSKINKQELKKSDLHKNNRRKTILEMLKEKEELKFQNLTHVEYYIQQKIKKDVEYDKSDAAYLFKYINEQLDTFNTQVIDKVQESTCQRKYSQKSNSDYDQDDIDDHHHQHQLNHRNSKLFNHRYSKLLNDNNSIHHNNYPNLNQNNNHNTSYSNHNNNHHNTSFDYQKTLYNLPDYLEFSPYVESNGTEKLTMHAFIYKWMNTEEAKGMQINKKYNLRHQSNVHRLNKSHAYSHDRMKSYIESVHELMSFLSQYQIKNDVRIEQFTTKDYKKFLTEYVKWSKNKDSHSNDIKHSNTNPTTNQMDAIQQRKYKYKNLKLLMDLYQENRIYNSLQTDNEYYSMFSMKDNNYKSYIKV